MEAERTTDYQSYFRAFNMMDALDKFYYGEVLILS